MDVKSISNVKRIPSLQSLQWGFMSDMAAMNGGAGCALYNSRQYHSPFSFCTQYAQCWMKHKLKSRLLGEISISSDTQMTPPFRKWRRTKEPLDESERGEWKSGLKLNIQKTKIMASSPITSWQIDGEIMETERDLSFWAPKSLQMVTAAMKL